MPSMLGTTRSSIDSSRGVALCRLRMERKLLLRVPGQTEPWTCSSGKDEVSLARRGVFLPYRLQERGNSKNSEPGLVLPDLPDDPKIGGSRLGGDAVVAGLLGWRRERIADGSLAWRARDPDWRFLAPGQYLTLERVFVVVDRENPPHLDDGCVGLLGGVVARNDQLGERSIDVSAR